jgi:serine/threonine protein phosphatase 1
MMFHSTHPANTEGRMFTCGDIHGMYDVLHAALDAVNFDRTRDQLIALGDLVDRGPDNLKVVELLYQPWFFSIMGNHEEMALMVYDDDTIKEWHIRNGGAWFDDLTNSERLRVRDLFATLPVTMTVETPTGRKIGLVHADMVGCDWDKFVNADPIPALREYALWSRDGRIASIKAGGTMTPITGVDHVYFGHTIFPSPITRANMSWIDTGSYSRKKITVIELM